MFKLRKVCAFLCSGAFALGNASGAGDKKLKFERNPMNSISQKKIEKNGSNIAFRNIIADNIVKEFSAEEKMRNCRKNFELIDCIRTYFLFGSCLGKTAKFAREIGGSSFFKDKKNIENLRKLDVNYFIEMYKSKQFWSKGAYVASWVIPIISDMIMSEIWKKYKDSIEYNISTWINKVRESESHKRMLEEWYSKYKGNSVSTLPERNDDICKCLYKCRLSLFKSDDFKELLKLNVGDSSTLEEITEHVFSEWVRRIISYIVNWCAIGGSLNFLSKNLKGQSDKSRAIVEELIGINPGSIGVELRVSKENAQSLTKNFYQLKDSKNNKNSKNVISRSKNVARIKYR